MKPDMSNQTWDTRRHPQRFNFALVICRSGRLRNSVIILLRRHGWLVHGVSRPEQAFSILAHIPYNLIVLDSELPGLCPTDFVPLLLRFRECRTIRIVVINNSRNINLESRMAECGALLATRTMWEDDLSGSWLLKLLAPRPVDSN
jgi:hypothetical protein